MKPLWAVARQMIAQGIRMRIAVVVMAAFVLLTPALPFLLKGDGTLRGQVQVFITYSLLFAALLLSILTLTLSTASLCGEVRDRQMFILDTKPIRRWQVLAGKWLGIMLINAALLTFMGATTYGFIRWLPNRGAWTPEEFKTERDQLNDEVLCARRSIKPLTPDVDKIVERELRRQHKAGHIPKGMTEAAARKRLHSLILRRMQTLPFGFAKVWAFERVPGAADPMGKFWVRFKCYGASELSSKHIDGLWRIGNPKTKRTFERLTRDTAGSFHEFSVPNAVVSDDGRLYVQFVNRRPDHGIVSFPMAEGIELLTPVGSFGANFSRGLVLIAIKLGFLAAVGLFCSTFLTLPVAVTLALCIYLLMAVSGFIAGIVDQGGLLLPLGGSHAGKPPPWYDSVLRTYLKGLVLLVPPSEEFSPIGKLNAGREVSWRLLGKALLVILLLRGGILALLGCHIFNRRELAGLKT